MNTETSSPFERLHRLEKAQALIEVIDRAVRSAGLDPHGDAYQVAGLLRRWTPVLWASAAIQAGKRAPSKETIDIVIAAIARRAA